MRTQYGYSIDKMISDLMQNYFSSTRKVRAKHYCQNAKGKQVVGVPETQKSVLNNQALMIFIKFALCIVLILALACTNSSKKSELQSFNDTVITNKLVKYKGDLVIKDPHKVAEFYQSFGDFLELPRIRESSSDMSLRIWLWGDSVHYVVNLQKNRLSYSGDLMTFYQTKPDVKDFIILHKIINLKPLSTWDALLPQLKAFKAVVFENPKTEGIAVLKGMRFVHVEIKEKGKYKFVKFLQPSFYWKINKDLQTVHLFLTTLAKEFKIPIYPPAERTFEEIY